MLAVKKAKKMRVEGGRRKSGYHKGTNSLILVLYRDKNRNGDREKRDGNRDLFRDGL